MQEETTPSPTPRDFWFLPCSAKWSLHPGTLGACFLFKERECPKKASDELPVCPQL